MSLRALGEVVMSSLTIYVTFYRLNDQSIIQNDHYLQPFGYAFHCVSPDPNISLSCCRVVSFLFSVHMGFSNFHTVWVQTCLFCPLLCDASSEKEGLQ